MTEISVHTDGAARGNPGPASVAYVIRIGEEQIEHAEVIGVTTNNQAEYRAMLAACYQLVTQSIQDAKITFFSDSELMIKQLKGEYRVKDRNLRPHYDGITTILAQLKAHGNVIELRAVRREANTRADALANQALDA